VPPGVTVGGIRYRLAVEFASAPPAGVRVSWGFIVSPEMVTTAADFSPGVHQHLDWMEYGTAVVRPAANVITPLVGYNGDDGFRTTRSRRLLREIEDELTFAIVSPNAVTYHLDSSIAVMLP
jgi:hypothetical protein